MQAWKKEFIGKTMPLEFVVLTKILANTDPEDTEAVTKLVDEAKALMNGPNTLPKETEEEKCAKLIAEGQQWARDWAEMKERNGW